MANKKVPEAPSAPATSAPETRKGSSLLEKARGKVHTREKKLASHPEKRPRETEEKLPEESSGAAFEEGSALVSQTEFERPAKRAQHLPTSPTTEPAPPAKSPILLDPVEWGRRALPSEVKAEALKKTAKRLVVDFHTTLLQQLATFEAFTHRAEVKRLACDNHVAEIEKQVSTEKNLRLMAVIEAKKVEDELRETLSSKEKALEAGKKAYDDEIEAHKRSREQSVQLLVREREKVIDEYHDSEELQNEVATLYRAGYNDCLKKVHDLYPDVDLSGAVLPPDDQDEGDVKAAVEAEIVDEAIRMAKEKLYEEAADRVVSEDSPVLPK